MPPESPVRRRRWLRRTAVAVPTTLAVVTASAYAATHFAGLPAPHTLIRVGTAPPSTWGDVFAQRAVPAGRERPLPRRDAPLPPEVPWPGGEVPLAEFLAQTHTNAFVVLQDGAVAHEWYADSVSDTDRLPSFSVAKAAVSLITGTAIARGDLSEDDLIVDLVPRWRTGGDFDRITVRHLLDMASGIDVSEVYHPQWPFTGTSLMYLVEDLPEFVQKRREVDSVPGTVGAYRSVNTMVLALLLEEVTGKNVSTLLSEDVWQPMGAEADARWSLDAEGGTEKAFAELHARARDFARFGQLVLDGGEVDGSPVLPPAWIDRISTPAPLSISEWGYSAQWWHVPQERTRADHATDDPADLLALGVYGQYVYVNPETSTVIVKLSDHGAEADERETVEVFRAMAAHLDAETP